MSADLPTAAAVKLNILVSAAEGAAALARAAIAALDDVGEQVLAWENRRDSAGTEAAQAAAAAKLAALAAELTRLRHEQKERTAQATAATQLVTQIKAWLRRLSPEVALAPAPAPAPVPAAGEDLPTAIERVRTKIKRRQHALQQLQLAPLPAADLQAAAVKLVDDLAEKGRPGLNIEAGRLSVTWRRRQDAATPGWTSADVTAFTAWLHRDALLVALQREIAAVSPPPQAATTSDAGASPAELEAEILRLERQEESLIELAQATGVTVLRRIHASPLAVLGVRIVSRATPRAA